MTIEETDPSIVSLEPAGFWIRAAARLIDYMVHGVVALIVGVVLAFIAYAIEGATGRPALDMIENMGDAKVINWISSFAASVGYHSLFEFVSGNTVGKRLLGLQVLSLDRSPLRFAQTFKRSLVFAVDAFFFGAVAARAMSESPEKQRLGDQWADTRVVYRRSLPLESLPSTMQFIAGLISAVQLAAVITAITAVLEYLWHIRGSL